MEGRQAMDRLVEKTIRLAVGKLMMQVMGTSQKFGGGWAGWTCGYEKRLKGEVEVGGERGAKARRWLASGWAASAGDVFVWW